MLLSIVIPTRNRAHYLSDALDALTKSCSQEKHIQITVVDDGSSIAYSKKNQALCRKYGAQYRTYLKNHGPAFARNRGLFESKGDWIAFLDDDVTVREDWYQNVRLTLNEVSSNTLGIEGVTKAKGTGLWDSEVENLDGGACISSNIIYRKDILYTLNGFDESFTGPYAEDQELALRVKKYGIILFNKSVIAFHQPRNINLSKHLLNTGKRMSSLLKAEFNFSMKHRDRYHTFRCGIHFWDIYGSILFKHWFTTLRRRKLTTLLRRPRQALVLLLSAIIEQLIAWILLPYYGLSMLYRHPIDPLLFLDKNRTAHLWRFNRNSSVSHITLRPKPIQSSLFPFTKRTVYNISSKVTKLSFLTERKNPNLFLRIDDIFFKDLASVDLLIKKAELWEVPFVAAITGDDFCNSRNRDRINQLVAQGAIVGIHGFNHQGTFGPFLSEILQLSFPGINDRLAKLTNNQLFQEIKPYVFIPPFNAISWDQLQFLGNTFSIICGGPESVRFTHYLFGPSVFANGSIFFPSLTPFYSQASKLTAPDQIELMQNSTIPLCITLHFTHEKLDQLSSLDKLITKIGNHLHHWDILRTSSKDSKKTKKEIS